MKHTKKVLYIMVMLAPLAILSMDKFGEEYKANEKTIMHDRYDNNECTKSYQATTKKSHVVFDKQQCEHNLYNKNARNFRKISLFSWIALGASCLAQKYDRSGTTRHPKFLASQYALAGSACTTTILAINQMWKAQPKATFYSLFFSVKKNEVTTAKDNNEQ